MLKGRIASFSVGFTLPRSAFRLILRNRRLLIWSILPVAVTSSLYLYGIVWLHGWIKTRIESSISVWGMVPGNFTSGLLLGILEILLVGVGALTFSTVAGVVASPFNDFLAEETERFAEPPLTAAPRLGWLGKGRILLIDLGKNAAAGTIALLALATSWIPGVGFFSFGIAMFLLVFQFISFPQTRRGMTWKDGMRFLFRHPYASLGFGSALSLLFAIPLVSAWVIPLAVVGGTLLVARAPSELR